MSLSNLVKGISYAYLTIGICINFLVVISVSSNDCITNSQSQCESNPICLWNTSNNKCISSWTTITTCPYIYDSDKEYAIPLNTCNIKYDEYISFEYYCQDNKIYKCIYNDVHCDGKCALDEYTGYDVLKCNNNICPMIQYNKYDNCQQQMTETISMVVDMCISNEKYNTSTMWKCKEYSMAKYMYNGMTCDDNMVISDEIFEFEGNKCIQYKNKYMKMEIINCSSPKCKLTKNNYNSFEICNIFDDTNVDKIIPFWNTYYNNYCDWFSDDISFSFNTFKCNKENGLTLSLTQSIISGTLNTIQYMWPNDLHRLNLNSNLLNGIWNWWALKSDKLEYIDISNNNLTGILQLFPLLYSNVLKTIKISNNPFMYGYIDWTLIFYMATQRNLNAFIATDIHLDGYADFTLMPTHKKISIAVDRNYQCNPYKYLCKYPLITYDRSNIACNDKYTCESTCRCSDLSTAIPTHFPYSPILDIISCGDIIDSKYELNDLNHRNMWGDNGHYYLIRIPYEYDNQYNVKYNVTFDATRSKYFNGRIIVYSSTFEQAQHAPHISDIYQKIYDINNPLKLTVELKSGNYYYLHIIANTTFYQNDCVDIYNNTEDKYWYWYKTGYYQAGYQCDYNEYEYTISMSGCTMSPTTNPTLNPTLFYSTTTTLGIQNTQKNTSVIFDIDQYENPMIIYDIYKRTEISMKIYVKSELKMDETDMDKFEWLMKDINSNYGIYISLNEYYGYKHTDITFYNTKTGSIIIDGIVYDVFKSCVIVASIRTSHAGYCIDKNKMKYHLLKPGTQYQFKLKVKVSQEIFIQSDNIAFITHMKPKGGTCKIYDNNNNNNNNNNNSILWHKYTVHCTDWTSYVEHDQQLQYNLLYSNIPLYEEFTSNLFSIKIGGDPSGDTQITALIQDFESVISCYDIVISLPSINNSSIDRLNDEISHIINSANNNMNNMDVISIFLTINNMKDLAQYIEIIEITNKLFDYLFKSSVVLNNNYTSSLQDKLLEISTLVGATYNIKYIGVDALDVLTYKYIPMLLQSVRDYININKVHHGHINNIGNIYKVIAIELNHLIQNLELTIESQYSDLQTTLAQNILHVGFLALLYSYPGEIFNYSFSNEKRVISQKFATHFDTNNSIICGFDNEYATIPGIINENNPIIDCSVLKYNNTISVNLYGGDSHLPINTYQETSQCNPYLITFISNNKFKHENSYTLYEKTSFPKCTILNNSNHKWYDDNCFVYSINNNITTCGCINLGTHEVIEDENIFIPIVVKVWNWRDLSSQNVHKHWIVWTTISILLVIIIFLSGLQWVDKTVNRPILAYEDIIFVKQRDERMKHDIVGKEIYYIQKYLTNLNPDSIGFGICKLLSTCTLSLCNLFKLHFKLYSVYLRSAHIFLSIFTRPSGSNISMRTRIGLFFMYLVNIFALTSVYYSFEFINDIINDIYAILIITMFSFLPVYYLQELFVRSKPKTIHKLVHLDEDIIIKDENKMMKYEENNLIINEVFTQSLQRLKRNSINEKISTLDIAVDELRKIDSNVHRLQLVNDIRITLLNTLYPLPHCCKCIAWFCLIIWTSSVSAIAILFSLQFNLTYETQMNPQYTNVNNLMLYEEKCWQNNKKLFIESELSYKPINELNDNINYKLHNKHYLPKYIGDSEENQWLILCIMSIILFLFILQPLCIYIATWFKIWMFSYNLQMKISIKNICILSQQIFCKYELENKNNSPQFNSQHQYISRAQKQINAALQMTHVNNYDYDIPHQRIGSRDSRDMIFTRDDKRKILGNSYYDSIINPLRKLDVFGFLCNNDLFLTIDKYGKLKNMYDDDDDDDEEEEETSILCLDQCSDDTIDDNDDELTQVNNNNNNNNNNNGHNRQISYSNLSITTTENGEIFTAEELAMMRVAVGNIFDYKADIIEEGNELEEDEETSNLFSFDLNSDGVEESEHDDDDSNNIKIYDDDFDDFDFNNTNTNDETLTKSETDDPSVSSDEHQLINTISIAIKDIEANNINKNENYAPKYNLIENNHKNPKDNNNQNDTKE